MPELATNESEARVGTEAVQLLGGRAGGADKVKKGLNRRVRQGEEGAEQEGRTR